MTPNPDTPKTPRSGWTEFVGDGIRRDHRTTCPATASREPGFECECPWSWWAPRVGGMPRRRSGPFTGTLEEATAAKAQQQHEAVELRERAKHGVLLPGGTSTVFEYFGAWMRWGSDRWSPSTLDSRSSFYRRMLHGYFGHLRMRDLTAHHLEAFIDIELRQGRGYRSVEFAFMAMRAMLMHAAARRVIPFNPADAVVLPPPPERVKRRDHMHAAEYAALVAACLRTEDELFVRLAGEAGLRRGEISGLRASDIDLKLRELTVFRTVLHPQGREQVVRIPKGGKPRVVPLTDGVVELLDAYLACEGIEGDEWLFRNLRGDTALPFKPETIRLRVQTCMVRAGLVRDNDPKKPAFTLHDLRRTAATQARERGVDPEIIRHALGHHRTFVTQRHYLRNRTHPQIRQFADALEDFADLPVHDDGDAGEAAA